MTEPLEPALAGQVPADCPAIRRPALALWAFIGIAAAGTVLAWVNRFVQDDAFISFNYARSLARGDGLTWFGTHVEGYTNFLWVLWSALGAAWQREPIAWSYVGGVTAFVVVLILTYRLSLALFQSPWPGVLATTFLVTNYSFSCYATGGLETMWQTAWITAAMWLACSLPARPTAARATALSFILAGACLTRMDSAVLGLIIGSAALVALFTRRAQWPAYVGLCLPFAVLIGAWLIWKWGYYGRLLPNTYYAKVRGLSGIEVGLLYVGRFLQWYFIWPFLVFGGVLLWRNNRDSLPRHLWPLAAAAVAWLAYIVHVGGDFMEFRFLVPICPILFLLVAYAVIEPIGRQAAQFPRLTALAAVVVLGLASAYHAYTFRGSSVDGTIDSIRTLATFYDTPNHRWDEMGLSLRAQLNGSDVLIATDAVGAVPYYSEIPTIDLYGLTDVQVAAHGRPIANLWHKPGHQVFATLPYLRARGVHLVLAQLKAIRRGTLLQPAGDEYCVTYLRGLQRMLGETLGHATIVSIPVAPEYDLVGWYLTPHPRIDELLRHGGWQRRDVVVPPN